ncbi:MAG TPA: DCC1-like thiol-disulfide oxidoreductase family protein [Salinivirgaceae bacterium]|nr:DCC1-like thiol-disulfide oxidoreductase family protein [Salinivirgaceae bacterium]
MTREKPILFYDSHCNLCHAVVNFIKKRCPTDRLSIVALDSQMATEILSAFSGDAKKIDSVVVLKNSRLYLKSSAMVEVLKLMPMPWKILVVTGIVPRFVRDRIYDFIAENRYRWFGVCEKCQTTPND